MIECTLEYPYVALGKREIEALALDEEQRRKKRDEFPPRRRVEIPVVCLKTGVIGGVNGHSGEFIPHGGRGKVVASSSSLIVQIVDVQNESHTHGFAVNILPYSGGGGIKKGGGVSSLIGKLKYATERVYGKSHLSETKLSQFQLSAKYEILIKGVFPCSIPEVSPLYPLLSHLKTQFLFGRREGVQESVTPLFQRGQLSSDILLQYQFISYLLISTCSVDGRGGGGNTSVTHLTRMKEKRVNLVLHLTTQMEKCLLILAEWYHKTIKMDSDTFIEKFVGKVTTTTTSESTSTSKAKPYLVEDLLELNDFFKTFALVNTEYTTRLCHLYETLILKLASLMEEEEEDFDISKVSALPPYWPNNSVLTRTENKLNKIPLEESYLQNVDEMTFLFTPVTRKSMPLLFCGEEETRIPSSELELSNAKAFMMFRQDDDKERYLLYSDPSNVGSASRDNMYKVYALWFLYYLMVGK